MHADCAGCIRAWEDGHNSRLHHGEFLSAKIHVTVPGLVVEITNVDAIKQWGITLYAPGGVTSMYFLKKQSQNLWVYYSITRVLPNSFLA
ncbi:MAG: hypothetical protein JWL65_5478 [Gammaproteobacteria bacterium]|nr:hypothetical protein [Gammaproteobacteria bacterium]